MGRDDGGEAIFHRADVSREADCEAMIEAAISHFGRLDILHNHAGILHPGDGPITELTEAVIDETFAINCKGMLFAAKHAVRHMIRAGGGAIVNTGSDLAFIGLANLTAYTASKAAVESLTRITAREVGPLGITCNAVGPTPIRTALVANVPVDKLEALIDRQAIREWATVDDVYNVVEFFLRPASRQVTGQVVYLGGIC